jgi:TRAP-type uncharacterized transport system substrate-binding protein
MRGAEVLNQDTGLIRRVVASTVVGILLAGIIVAIVVFVTGRPPRRFAIAAGQEGGQYYQVAATLRNTLASRGFGPTVLETNGSEENVRALQDGRALVGLVQSGTDSFVNMSGISALSELFYEPVWIFINKARYPVVNEIGDLAGARIGIGPDGSGTQEIANAFLSESAIATEVTPVAADTDDAATMLGNGELDAAFFVMAPTAPLMEQLIANENLSIFNFRNAEAYARRFPSLSAVTLSRGVLDIARDIPPVDTQLIAARATLVGRTDLHPDLARLFVEVLPGVLPYPLVGAPAAFPSLAQTRFPVNDDAQRFLVEGRTPLEDFLPFEIASPLSRWYLIALPLLVLVFPVSEILRAIYGWYMSSRVVGYYPRIHAIERNLRRSSVQQLDEQLAYLQGLDEQLPHRTRVTAGYLSSYFQLKSHLRDVIGRVEARRAELVATTAEPAAAQTTDAEAVDVSGGPVSDPQRSGSALP